MSSSMNHINYMLNEVDKIQKTLLLECEVMLSKPSISAHDIQESRVLGERIEQAKKTRDATFALIETNYYQRIQNIADISSRQVVYGMCNPLIEKAAKEIGDEKIKSQLASLQEQLKQGIDVWAWLYTRLCCVLNAYEGPDKNVLEVLIAQIRVMRAFHHSAPLVANVVS